uniref:Uncharacterized protein n=1 Tax=Thermocrispum agreste TaxID=37925 RepID=A0A2W4JII0_9PSEU|nr:MAG: hypothetical protein DIU77_15160 [Thermocrispum agreste]
MLEVLRPGPCAGGLLGAAHGRHQFQCVGPCAGGFAVEIACSLGGKLQAPRTGGPAPQGRTVGAVDLAGPPHGRACCPPRVTGGKMTR